MTKSYKSNFCSRFYVNFLNRKFFVLFLIITIIIPFCGCGFQTLRPLNSSKPKVISTIFAPYDFARQVSGELADVSMLLPPGSEPHSFEPSPKDIINIKNADVFIYTGGANDSWVDTILASIDTQDIKIIRLLDVIPPEEEEIIEGMTEETHDEGVEGNDEHTLHKEAEYDEHVWTSPKNAELIVQKISDTLCEVDAENSEKYRAKTVKYIEDLRQLDSSFKTLMNNAARKTIVFGDRFPFRYFADYYDLNYFAAFPGCASETEASAQTIAFLINKVRAESIPIIFKIELSNGKIADSIAEQTGAEVLTMQSCHNVTTEEFNNGVTYISLMQSNYVNLTKALL
ncbi:MAG: metal ABC transporter substrate-binding protein [Clostridiales bacterium]|jgi:zinc transport system substrate-binding protein|nr:metal ABC transporter substrate-binding protein [Clostridiales bacterium]